MQTNLDTSIDKVIEFVHELSGDEPEIWNLLYPMLEKKKKEIWLKKEWDKIGVREEK